MPTYTCERCKFTTTLKSNYTNHILTPKHIKNIQNAIPVTIPIPETTKEVKCNCKYCNQEFNHDSSMYRHMKYSCYEKKEDIKETIKLIKNEFELNRNESKKDLIVIFNQIEILTKQIKVLSKQFETIEKIQINKRNILAYNDTDISHLTDDDYLECLKYSNYCVKILIEKIHFNPEKPDNMNIRMSNLKDKYFMIYDGTYWNTEIKENRLKILYDTNERILEEWIETTKEEHVKDKFKRYLENKNDEMLTLINDEVKTMIYNKSTQFKLFSY
jgi:hypothetical protein